MNRIARLAPVAAPAMPLAATVVAALAIAAAPDFTARYVAALCLALVWPGLGLARWLAGRDHDLTRAEFAVIGLALGYVSAICSTLVVYYLPGPPALPVALAIYAVAAAVPWVASARGRRAPLRPDGRWALYGLIAVIVLATALVAVRLHYSEFQGDEAMVMLDAGTGLSGDDTVLFFHRKGPAEILLPMALWLLGGSTHELAARVPFALAGVLAVAALFLLARRMFNERVATAAAGLFALNGLFVGFSRIVQYQSVVMMCGATALLCFYIFFKEGNSRLQIAGAALVAAGLLAHYDAVFVLPVIGYLYVYLFVVQPERLANRAWIVAAAFGLGILALFYWPFLSPAYLGNTSEYLAYRSGGGIWYNNLSLWLHVSATYNSFPYVVFLLICLAGWALRRMGRRGPMPISIALLTAAMALAVIIPADERVVFVPFLCTIMVLLLSRREGPEPNAALIWFAVPFLSYGFLVGRPGTHFWTMFPGLTLIAGCALDHLVHWLADRGISRRSLVAGQAVAAVALVAWFGGYLYVAFLRPEPDFRAGYPATLPAVYPSPYQALPERDFFGFPHRAGWQTVGDLYRAGRLSGEFAANEGPEITTWYVPAPRHVCRPEPAYYFLASSVMDRVDVPEGDLMQAFDPLGQVTVEGRPSVRLFGRGPSEAGRIEAADVGMQPLAAPRNHLTAMAAYMQHPLSADFGGEIELLGYDLDGGVTCPGGRPVVTLYWRRHGPAIAESYKIFVHVESERLWAAGDDLPGCGIWPTTVWREGEVIADRHVLELPEELPPGDYPISVGLYEPDTGRRVDVKTDGQAAGTALTLAHLAVRPVCP